MGGNGKFAKSIHRFSFRCDGSMHIHNFPASLGRDCMCFFSEGTTNCFKVECCIFKEYMIVCVCVALQFLSKLCRTVQNAWHAWLVFDFPCDRSRKTKDKKK